MIPDRISTAAEAEAALSTYRRAVQPKIGRGQLEFYLSHQRWLGDPYAAQEAATAFRRLAMVWGPGPVVLEGPAGFLGRLRHHPGSDLPPGRLYGTPPAYLFDSDDPTEAKSRGRWVVEMVGPVRPDPWDKHPLGSAAGWLIETSANVQALAALADRLHRTAEALPMREAKPLRAEASELAEFQARLESRIPDLGATFLSHWSAAADDLKPPQPELRSAEFRKASLR